MAKLAARTPMTPAPETAARRPSVTVWWLAAVAAVIAVAVAIVLLTGARPSPAKLQAVQARSVAEAPGANAALAAPHAAGSLQAATTSKAKATETAAQAGVAGADATAQDVSAAAEPAPR
jgi:uncharacterized membrane protein